VAAFKAAVQVGIGPVEFWEMTPYLTNKAVISKRDGKMRELWTLAALQRQKKLPKIETFMIDKGPPKDHKQMESELKKALGIKKRK